MSGRADWYLSVGATASSAKTWQTSNLSRPRRPPEASPRASPRPTQTTCLPERDGKGTLTKHEKNKGGESRPYVKVTNTCARHAVYDPREMQTETSQLVRVSSTRVEAARRTQVEAFLRRSDGGSTKTARNATERTRTLTQAT